MNYQAITEESEDGRQNVSMPKCRGSSTPVGRSVGSPDTLSNDRSSAKQISSVFNQLPLSRFERVFGRRTALFHGVEREETNPLQKYASLGFRGLESQQPQTVSEFLGKTEHLQKEKENDTAKDVGFSAFRGVVVVRLSGYGPGK